MPKLIWFKITTGILLFIVFSCTPKQSKLPIYGKFQVVNEDTVYHTIPPFEFIDQDSNLITNETFEGKWYIADFFFTSCPTICPRVKQQLMRIYEKYEQEDRLKFLSHSIDTKRDSVPVLKKYSDKLGITSERWHLVTGDKSSIYKMAPEYFSIAIEDENSPGGYDHSGYIVLIDPERHIRGFCDGTIPEEVDKFMKIIRVALDEK
jgi:protein SCO1